MQEVRRTAAELDGPPAAAPAATASARPAEPAMAPSVEARARLRSRLAAGHAEVERRRDEESRREERADKRERRDKRERKRRGRSHSRKGPAGERPREKAREAVALPGTLRAARKSRQAAELARRGSEGVGPPRGGREEPAAEGSGSFSDHSAGEGTGRLSCKFCGQTVARFKSAVEQHRQWNATCLAWQRWSSGQRPWDSCVAGAKRDKLEKEKAWRVQMGQDPGPSQRKRSTATAAPSRPKKKEAEPEKKKGRVKAEPEKKKSKKKKKKQTSKSASSGSSQPPDRKRDRKRRPESSSSGSEQPRDRKGRRQSGTVHIHVHAA